MPDDLKQHIAQIANYVQAQSTQPTLVEALREVLTDSSDDAPVLIKRIPLICNDIRIIKNNLWWLMALLGATATTVGGAVALAIFNKII